MSTILRRSGTGGGTGGGTEITVDGVVVTALDIDTTPVTEARSWPINPRTASYTLALVDEGRCVEMDSASATTVTVPSFGTIPFPIGASVRVRRLGAGSVTVAAAGGVTINPAGSLVLPAQYATVELHQRDANSWIVQTL